MEIEAGNTHLCMCKNFIQRLENIEEKLSVGEEAFLFFRDGLLGYRERFLKSIPVSQNNEPISNLNGKILNDKDLRFPHRKILEFLQAQYDFTTNQFKEVHFSRLVKETRIGKNMANGYLSLLEKKRYITKRSDGYRKFFKIQC